MKEKLIVGVLPTYVIEKENNPYWQYNRFIGLYTKKISDNGMIPIGIILDGEKTNYDTLELCDAFVIQGGNKVRKYVYEIIDYALNHNKPILGICMGAEAIAIYSCIREHIINTGKTDLITAYVELKKEYGGTLLRKLNINNYHDYDFNTIADIEPASHQVIIEKDSIAYSIYGQYINAPSMHSYDFKHVGTGFKVTGKTEDGVSEIIEYDDKNYFIIGTHFHSEILYDNKIFQKLKEEILKRKSR